VNGKEKFVTDSFRSVAALALLAAVISGCATGPKIYTSQDPQAYFAGYRTFAFEEILGTDRPGGQRSIVSSHLVRNTQAEMERRGYKHDPDNPDLIINFFLNTQEKIQARSTPTGGAYGYGAYRRGYYGTWGGYETTITQYTEGSLNIDIVEVKRDQLVWEGVAVGRLRKDSMEKLDERAPIVVGEIFAEFPHTATNP